MDPCPLDTQKQEFAKLDPAFYLFQNPVAQRCVSRKDPLLGCWEQ